MNSICKIFLILSLQHVKHFFNMKKKTCIIKVSRDFSKKKKKNLPRRIDCIYRIKNLEAYSFCTPISTISPAFFLSILSWHAFPHTSSFSSFQLLSQQILRRIFSSRTARKFLVLNTNTCLKYSR